MNSTSKGTDYLRGRLADIADQLEAIHAADTDDDERDTIMQGLDPLSIETETVVRVVFGTGGPHDEWRYVLRTDPSGESYVDRVDARYADWGTTETVPLEGDDERVALDYWHTILADWYVPS